MDKETRLLSSPAYEKATVEERYNKTNGCGPHNELAELVPDYLLGLSIIRACDIHDWDYYHIKNERERRQVDKKFLKNMKTLVQKKSSNKLIRAMRTGLAYVYYWAVRVFGRDRY